jgi:uncharacterized protein HemX
MPVQAEFLGLAGLAFVPFVAKSLSFAPTDLRRSPSVSSRSFDLPEKGRASLSFWVFKDLMTPIARAAKPISLLRSGTQPIALAAATLLIVLAGIASIALWRTYTGKAPELDRVVAARVLQARTAQASEQLVEKTKGLEATQQESIDQLQVVQNQLSTVRRLLASQQADTKRLSEQVSTLTEAVDGLRQSFASAQPAAAPSRKRPGRARASVAKRAKPPHG